MTLYGIYWTREGIKPGQYVYGDEIAWDAEDVVRAEFERREDKYWPSVLFSAEITNMQVVEEGTCPWEGG